MRRILFLALGIFVLSVSAVRAQELPAADLSVGHSYFRERFSNGVNANGGTAALTGYVNRGLALPAISARTTLPRPASAPTRTRSWLDRVLRTGIPNGLRRSLRSWSQGLILAPARAGSPPRQADLPRVRAAELTWA